MGYNTGYLSGPFYFGGLGAPKVWMYDDTVAAATVIASGYISDGFFRGMEVGDLVYYRRFSTLSPKAITSLSTHYVTACTSAENTTLSAAIGDTSGLTVSVTSATSTPGATQDVNSGFSLGSLWVETDVDEVWANTDTTSGSAIWYPLTDHFMLTYSGVSLATPSVGLALPVPAAGRLDRADVVLVSSGTALNATAVLVMSRNATAITNGTLTVANAATGGGTAVANPTALNSFSAGDILNVAVSTTQNVAKSANFVAYFKRTA